MWCPEAAQLVDSDQLVEPLARGFARHIGTCSDFVRLVDCRRSPETGLEIITFDMDIGVPQRPVYAINSTETISVCFLAGNAAHPFVAVGREDFPDTPHQNLVPEGFPSIICIDDRPWQDIRGDYAASELMARIQLWFTKACEGELHGEDQPFDPYFIQDGDHEIILTQEAADAISSNGKLSIWAAEQPPRLLILTAARQERMDSGQLHLHVLHVDVAPGEMKRMRRSPRTLAQLVTLLGERGTDLLEPLKRSVLEWLAAGKTDKDVSWLTCILVSMPQIHPKTLEIGANKPMAFLCIDSPGRIGEALGVLTKNDSGAADGVNYLQLVVSTPIADGLDAFQVQIAPVYQELDASAAVELAGGRSDQREIVLIGAGSLGSHIGEYLVREGLFRWTVVDDDVLLPHNLARHTLTRGNFGQSKALNLVAHFESIRSGSTVAAIPENVLRTEPTPLLKEALGRAEVILDASASVPVSRWLSDRNEDARRLCAFFTPDGRSAVLMSEPADRALSLRDIEAAYLREILVNPLLADHLRSGPQMRYSGACRALTSRIPASSVALLSGILARGISSASSEESAVLRIWTMRDDGGVHSLAAAVSTIHETISGWTVTLPAATIVELRQRRDKSLPSETGGPLVGLIDQEAKRVAVVHALAAPPDSTGSPMEFVRGTRGLLRQIEDARTRTGGQVRYIGEWHSHPRGSSVAPSATDLRQICELSLITDLDGLPALSLIVGEDGLGMLLGKVA
jgi:hypothetical protein